MAVELAQPLTHNIKAQRGSLGNSTPDLCASNALLHELQLGEQLNQSVQETRRADFTLMLAMLTEDVREQSQFLLPQTPATSPKALTNTAFRKEFNLPEKAPLALTSLTELTQFNQVQSIIDNNLADIHLTNALQPKPLAFRDDKTHIDRQILENTSLLTQLKHNQLLDKTEQVRSNNVLENKAEGPDKSLSQSINQQMNFNAKAWLDGIQQSLVKAPLLN